jgi:methionyl-tRNA formyltransferase
MAQQVRFAFAGDRDIAAWVLEYLLGAGHRPLALLLSSPKKATHAERLRELCPYLPDERVFRGKAFRRESAMRVLDELALDYVVGVHFPYIISREVLAIPRVGFLNLHPAYLPYNRGWHTASWAILEDTPIGATLHFMDEGIDSGDIVRQERLDIGPADTAHTLYQRLKKLELELFRRAWPALADGTFSRAAQDPGRGTQHVRSELLEERIQRIDLEATCTAQDLLRHLRGLTTSEIREAAYFDHGGRKYRVQVRIVEEEEQPTDSD